MRENKKAIKRYLEKFHLLWCAKVCAKIVCSIIYFLQSMFKRLEALWRKLGGFSKNYSELKSMSRIHEGHRCFIIATGPSLKVNDVERLRKEYTFSMNSIINIFCQTDWRPTYYGIQDEIVYARLKNDINFKEIEHKFIAKFIKNKTENEINPVYYPLELLNHLLPYQGNKYRYRFSGNAYLTVYDGFTVTFSLIQIAVYMGFKEIYLLGCDCDYSGPKQHFADYGIKSDSNTGDKMIFAYQAAKAYADSHGIKIYNATRGGKLEVFERVDFDSLFPNKDDEDKCSES